jgi:murein DD-endopeptidase MepM/ murein hydrolase activator NlpD
MLSLLSFASMAMRTQSAFRSRLLGQAALVVLLAGMSASCSNSLRLGEGPEFTGSTENQREIIGQNNAGAPSDQDAYRPAPAPNNAVTSADIPPPPSNNYAPNNNYASAEPAPSYTPPPAAPAAAAPGSTFVWTAVGGRVVALKSGETLNTLETKYGVPGEPSPAADAPLRQTEMASGSTYTVQPGDTLYSVARKNGTTVASLARMNGLEMTAALTTGERLKLDGAARPAVAAAEPQRTQPTPLGAPPRMLGTLTMRGANGQSDGAAQQTADAAPAPAPKIKLASPADTAESGSQYADNSASAPAPNAGAQAMPTIPVAPQAGDQPAAQNASINPADTVADAPSADGKQFRWPVRGRIISGFGTKPNGEKNDGINLAVPEGTSVKSVEAGTVIYAGNELAGYGNLVLVRHAGGWVSAYAHNKDLLVKKGDTVQRGQTIAHAGMTGSVTSPQVHFELRQGAKPVNPLDYLAGA